mmetsp:Transcript_36368/g.58309  ORF Transcript_36368/g.58309 Transcript_36368/m.58309 type:complete len:941 (+) Transcript_36368:440-3262(+)
MIQIVNRQGIIMGDGWGQYEDIEDESSASKSSAASCEKKKGGNAQSNSAPKTKCGANGAPAKASEGKTEDAINGGASAAENVKAVDVADLHAAPPVVSVNLENGNLVAEHERPIQNVSSVPQIRKNSQDEDELGVAAKETNQVCGFGEPHKGSCPNFGSLEAAHQRIFDSGLTFSEAKGEIWKLRKGGTLMKRGFRYRKLWVNRYVELSGRLLKYYEHKPVDESSASNPRGKLELTTDTRVERVASVDGKKFAFNVIPGGSSSEEENIISAPSPVLSSDDRRKKKQHQNKTGSSWWGFGKGGSSSKAADAADHTIWRLMARSESEREEWIQAILRAIQLISRVHMPPTLSGIGSVHYHYTIGGILGKGRFGDVYSGVATTTGLEYAIKVVDKEKRVKTKEDATKLRNEIRVMRRITRELDHANICKLFQAYEDNFMVYLVMEKLSGLDLIDHIAAYVSPEDYSEAFCADIVRQIASGLKELQGAGIVLCDLCPENLLFVTPTSTVIKVCEFGNAMIMNNTTHAKSQSGRGGAAAGGRGPQNAATFTPGMIGRTQRRGPIVGEPGFIAPEVIATREYSHACDIWALGCMLFLLTMGSKPFEGKTQTEIFSLTALGLQADTLKKEDWDHFAPSLKPLIGSTLSTQRARRMDANGILSSKWITEASDNTVLKSAHARITSLSVTRKKCKVGTVSPAKPVSCATSKGARARSQSKGDEKLGHKETESSQTLQKLSRKSSRSSPDMQVENNGIKDTAGDSSMVKQSSKSSYAQLLHESTHGLDFEKRAELLALDVRAEKIRAQNSVEDWNLQSSPRTTDGEDSQANFSPAGRFLSDLETQMRLVRESELEASGATNTTVANGSKHAVTAQQAIESLPTSSYVADNTTEENTNDKSENSDNVSYLGRVSRSISETFAHSGAQLSRSGTGTLSSDEVDDLRNSPTNN